VWSFIAVLIAIGVIWLALRKSSINPKIVLLIAVPVLAVLLVLFLAERGPADSGTALTGAAWLEPSARPSIDLSADLKTLDGRSVALKDFKGKVLFLNV